MPNVIPTVETPISRQYIGARYVPIFDGAWDNTKEYNPLTVVSYQGNSYTSRTFVPTNIDITDETYWALTGNYNAQVEAYRQEVAEISDTFNDIQFYVTPQMYGAAGDGIANDTTAIQEALDSDFDVIIPEGNYKITSPLTITKNKNVKCFGLIVVDADCNGIIVGNDDPDVDDKGWFIGKSIKLNISKRTLNWGADFTGVKLINVWRAEIEIKVTGFYTGLKLVGNNYGCAWNLLHNISIYNCFNGVVLEKVENGWVNQNTFIGGSIAWSHSSVTANTTTSDPVTGLTVIGTDNSFYNLAIDGGGTVTSDYDYYTGIDCAGSWCHFNNMRLERVHLSIFTGNWNTLRDCYMFEYMTITKSNLYSVQIFGHQINTIIGESESALDIISLKNNGDLLRGYNSSNVKVAELANNGLLTLSSALLIGNGIGLFGYSPTNIDNASADTQDNGFYISRCRDNANAQFGIVAGYKYNEDNESQLLIGLYNLKYRTKVSGTWGNWTTLA